MAVYLLGVDLTSLTCVGVAHRLTNSATFNLLHLMVLIMMMMMVVVVAVAQ